MEPHLIVVGLTGHKRSGKNSVANILVKDFGFKELSFAAALKDILTETNPILGVDRNGRIVRLSHLIIVGWDEDRIKASTFGKEYRRLLEKLGTEGVRKYDDDFWINTVTSEIQAELGTDARFVITDCRFPNEPAALRTFQDLDDHVEIWQVDRPGTEPTGELHSSEKHVGNMGEDLMVLNHFDLAHLSEEVATIVANLLPTPTT